MRPLRLGLVGVGKIARDQHIPAIAATPGIELVAVASRNGRVEGMPHHPDIAGLLAGGHDLDAVALCQPPQVRHAAARAALAASMHVFMEKPPGATVSEVQALDTRARQAGVTLFASWHSRYGAAVATARAWIAGRRLVHVRIDWKEDVRVWHPGQDWIWRAGGLGVFDPGINALSILTDIVPDPIHLLASRLEMPANRDAPIAATLSLATAGDVPIDVTFDWRQAGAPVWDIVVETDGGTMRLSHGGNRLEIDGANVAVAAENEYPAMYRHFVDLVNGGRSDVDLRPLLLVADAFLHARFHRTEAFYD